MKTTSILLFLCLLMNGIYNTLVAQNTSDPQKLNLMVSNICEFVGQMVVCNGTDSLLVSPSYGSAGNIYAPNYVHYDSISVLDNVKYFDVSEDGPQIYVQKLLLMGDENKLITYLTSFTNWGVFDPIILPRDTIVMDSIVDAKIDYNKIMIIRSSSTSDNFIIYDTTSSVPLFSTNVGLTPLLVDITYGQAAIVGLNAANGIQLKIYNTNTFAVTEDTVFGVLAGQPISLKAGNNAVYLVSQPGDSAVYMTYFNRITKVITTTSMYSSSGTHAFVWDISNFNFQPESDLTGNNLDTKVIRFEPVSMQNTVYNTNRRFHKLIFAGDASFGYYDFMHGVEESSMNNKVIIYTAFNYTELDSFITNNQVDFIKSDFRCPVGLEEYDDSKVSMTVFPNPTSNGITVMAKGLICGRDYKMDLIDLNGKSYYNQVIHAKMSLEILMENLTQGVYILRIYTLRGFVTQKIIKN